MILGVTLKPFVNMLHAKKGQTMVLSFIKCRSGLNAISKARKQGAKPVAYACNSIMGSYWVFETLDELDSWLKRQPLNPHFEII